MPRPRPHIDFLFWDTSTKVETVGGQKTRVANCNGFEATNSGNSIVTVNDQILYPGVPGTSNGDSKSWGGNVGEIYLGPITVKFPPGAVNPSVTITQKFYLIDENVISNAK